MTVAPISAAARPDAPASGSGSRHAREQQRIEALGAATIRALSGQFDLQFRGGRLHRGLQRLPGFAPHLHPTLAQDDLSSFRGAADGLALRLSLSDPLLHRSHCPAAPTARWLFELLEQLRVESQADPRMPGLRRNLAHRFDAWSGQFHSSGLTETTRGLLLYTVTQMARARVLGTPVLEASAGLIEHSRGMLGPLIGIELAALRRHCSDQQAYAGHARGLAERVDRLLDASAQGNDPIDADSTAAEAAADRFSLWRGLDFENGDAGAAAVAATERSRTLDAASGVYRVFSADHDRTQTVASLLRPVLLRDCREQLDRRVGASAFNPNALARRLKALLAMPTVEGSDGAQEAGRIDGARLSQLVASPSERRLFRAERIEPVAHTALSFLLDCSGSMKQHAEATAVLVDAMARAGDAAGVSTEILGYTTRAWNGGRARRDWQHAGRPRNPGRLNERQHLVFKDADTPWRRARPAIAGLLRTDLYREGIDGEAVDWACSRLDARPEPQRLLVVVSDGCPMDTATAQANDPAYLEQHLLQVVQRHEAAGRVRIHGLGVGLDLGVFYTRRQSIDLWDGVTEAVLRDLLTLLGGRGRG